MAQANGFYAGGIDEMCRHLVTLDERVAVEKLSVLRQTVKRRRHIGLTPRIRDSGEVSHGLQA